MWVTSATKKTSEMTQEPQRLAREEGNREGHDGLAAVAIALLTVSLLVLLVSKIIS